VPTQSLLKESWIRLEFKKDNDQGQVRVYVLPEDFGRTLVNRDNFVLKQALQKLLSHLDTSNATWLGNWSVKDPVKPLSTSLDGSDIPSSDDTSLLEIFNSLPSPQPDPSMVKNRDARLAMRQILRGNVEGLKTKMIPYQRRTAAMMLQREAQPGRFLDPRLAELKDNNDRTWYYDPSEAACFRDPRMYDAPAGGICAETMGLGKTLICLALILATKDNSSHIPLEYSAPAVPVRDKVGCLVQMSAAAITRTSTPWKGHFRKLKEIGLDYAKCVKAIQANIGYYTIPPHPLTPGRRKSARSNPPAEELVHLSTASLIVVPPNLVRQWEHEIEKHTTGLKVLVMTENKQMLPPVKELIDYDIILFSRQRFEVESKDGTDSLGRRSKSSDIKARGGAHDIDVTSADRFDSNKLYKSPLRSIHFKRLITDEGHIMGNASSTTQNNAAIVVDFLKLTSKWVISGTPTPGLFGLEPTLDLGSEVDSLNLLGSSGVERPVGNTAEAFPSPLISDCDGNRILLYEQERRRDLEKLGNIMAVYLKVDPWARDGKLWFRYVIKGTPERIRAAMKTLIIRHRLSDVENEVQLPPLHKKTVYLKGSLQDKISLNLFAMMINANAVTSERKDVDFLFHPGQRKALSELVSNLRAASFFWSGFSASHLMFTMGNTKRFLEKLDSHERGTLMTSDADRQLLMQSLECGNAAMNNSIWSCSSSTHDIPIYLSNKLIPPVRKKCSLDGLDGNPTLFSIPQLVELRKKLTSPLSDDDLMHGLELFGLSNREAQVGPRNRNSSSDGVGAMRVKKLMDKTLKSLEGGENTGLLTPPRGKGNIRIAKKKKLPGKAGFQDHPDFVAGDRDRMDPASPAIRTSQDSIPDNDMQDAYDAESQHPAPHGPFGNATILSTASSKLSYLLDQVLLYQVQEKIIIFYENDNVAYYISQALDAVGVPNLIYAKTLTSDRRSRYLVTFNTVAHFRVLVMDISQAAFGLDVSCASRVYFVNPVVSKQVEAQAVKRAHRIGQTRPVYVETLVLQSSIEELIVQRREQMSTDEQKKCKSILDDTHMYDWIKNVRFVPLPDLDAPGTEQMAQLHSSTNVFARDAVMHNPAVHDPDSGLVVDRLSSKESSSQPSRTATPRPQKRRRAAVLFAGVSTDDDDGGEAGPSKKSRAMERSAGDSMAGVVDASNANGENSRAAGAPAFSSESAELAIRKNESMFWP